MRLDKFISNNSEYTRSDVRKLVKAQRVQVNGELAEDVAMKVKGKKDKVTVDEQVIELIGSIYFMLNKPTGYVCAKEDGNHPTVIDLIKKEANFINNKVSSGLKHGAIPFKDLQIVGRLDVDTTGLLLLTNDGDWNHKVTSPNTECKKAYRVSLEQAIDMKTLTRFTKGMALEGEKKPTRPAMVDIITPKKLRLSISEGKYHQVKRMFAATGNKVKKLHRESIGNIVLDSSLEPGQFRELTKEEVKSIIKSNNGLSFSQPL